jgi:hypothetical protein
MPPCDTIGVILALAVTLCHAGDRMLQHRGLLTEVMVPSAEGKYYPNAIAHTTKGILFIGDAAATAQHSGALELLQRNNIVRVVNLTPDLGNTLENGCWKGIGGAVGRLLWERREGCIEGVDNYVHYMQYDMEKLVKAGSPHVSKEVYKFIDDALYGHLDGGAHGNVLVHCYTGCEVLNTYMFFCFSVI